MPLNIPYPHPTKSFWLDDIPLLESSVPIPDETDVVIIGSGISGASAAYHLQKVDPALKVVVFEARDFSSGATGRNGGHLTPDSYRNFRSDELKHGLDQAILFRTFEKENVDAITSLNIECDLVPVRNVQPFEAVDDFENAKMDIERMRSIDPALVEGIEITPAKTSKPFIGSVSISAHSIYPAKLTWELLRRSNALLYNHAIVTKVDNSLVTFHRNEKIYTIKAKYVIHATNAYASSLLPQLEGSIIPTRGQMSIQSPRILDDSYSFHNGAEYMISRPEGMFLGGGRSPSRGLEQYETNDGEVNGQISIYLGKFLKKHFGSATKTTREWTGIMGFTKDGHPYIGQLNEHNFVSVGFGGHGMPRAFLSAKYLVDCMINGRSDVALPEAYKVSQKRLQSAIQPNPLQGLGGCRLEEWTEAQVWMAKVAVLTATLSMVYFISGFR